MDLQYKLVYKKGIENKAADAISRVHPQNNLEILAMFSSNQSGCRLLWTVIPNILKQPNCNRLDSFELKEDLIRYKGRVVIPLDLSLQTQIMQALHSSAIWGHSGFLVTYHRIKSIFFVEQDETDDQNFCHLLSSLSTSQKCEGQIPQAIATFAGSPVYLESDLHGLY